MVFIVLIIVSSAILETVFISYQPLFSQVLKLEYFLSAVYIIASAGSTIGSQILKIFLKKPDLDAPLIYYKLLLSLLSLILVSTLNIYLIFIGIFICGILSGFYIPIVNTNLHKLIDSKLRNSVVSSISSFLYIGYIGTNIIVSLLMLNFGVSKMYLFILIPSAIFCFVAVIYKYIIKKNQSTIKVKSN